MGAAPVVPTVSAKVLLGWMERDMAVKFLKDECVFQDPIAEEKAEFIWREKYERVQALPERLAGAPPELPLNDKENAVAQIFLRSMAGAANIKRVIKIDPIGLVTYQPYVVLQQTEKYRPFATSAASYAAKSLTTVRQVPNVQLRYAVNAIDAAVPHGEFMFFFNPQSAKFEIQEQARHISVTEFQGRMLLWAGYHRSYARIASAKPDGSDRSLLVALTTDGDFFVSPQSPNQGLRAMVCGRRPSLLGDFFDGDLFMAVNLKRKRWMLQIRAACVPVDDV